MPTYPTYNPRGTGIRSPLLSSRTGGGLNLGSPEYNPLVEQKKRLGGFGEFDPTLGTEGLNSLLQLRDFEQPYSLTNFEGMNLPMPMMESSLMTLAASEEDLPRPTRTTETEAAIPVPYAVGEEGVSGPTAITGEGMLLQPDAVPDVEGMGTPTAFDATPGADMGGRGDVNPLMNMINQSFMDLLSGKSPAQEQNIRMAQTSLDTMSQQIDAQTSRQAARMGIKPGTKEYNDLQARNRQTLLSKGSQLMSGITAQGLMAQERGLGAASRFGLGQEAITEKRFQFDTAFKEDVRRSDRDYNTNVERYGVERADAMALNKAKTNLALLGYTDIMSPGQVGAVKGELGAFTGAAGAEEWGQPMPTQYEEFVDYYKGMGYSDEEAKAKADQLRDVDPLQMFLQMAGLTGANVGGGGDTTGYGGANYLPYLFGTPGGEGERETFEDLFPWERGQEYGTYY